MIPEGGKLLHRGAEDIVVLRAGLLHDLHIGAVQGAQGHGAAEHQLHISRAGGLGARGGDLLGDVGGGDDVLGVGAVIVLYEHHLHLPGHGRIAVDQLCQAVEVADDGLGAAVARGGLGAEEEEGGGEVGQASLLEGEVDVQNGEAV